MSTSQFMWLVKQSMSFVVFTLWFKAYIPVCHLKTAWRAGPTSSAGYKQMMVLYVEMSCSYMTVLSSAKELHALLTHAYNEYCTVHPQTDWSLWRWKVKHEYGDAHGEGSDTCIVSSVCTGRTQCYRDYYCLDTFLALLVPEVFFFCSCFQWGFKKCYKAINQTNQQ